jgi:hypothetical protein
MSDIVRVLIGVPEHAHAGGEFISSAAVSRAGVRVIDGTVLKWCVQVGYVMLPDLPTSNRSWRAPLLGGRKSQRFRLTAGGNNKDANYYLSQAFIGTTSFHPIMS